MKVLSTPKALWTALVLAVLLPALAVTAMAQDSHVPRGGSHRWLPCDNTQMFHWLPVDQQQLFDRLRMPARDVYRWLKTGEDRSLTQLAAERGVDVKALKSELLSQWAGKASASKLRAFRGDVNDLFSQGHLSQHTLFHPFHNPGFALHAREIVGMSTVAYLRARSRGKTVAELARQHGITRAQAGERAIAVMRGYQDKAVRRGLTSSTQADAYIADLRARLEEWLDRRFPVKPSRAELGLDRKPTMSHARRSCLIFLGKRDTRLQRPALLARSSASSATAVASASASLICRLGDEPAL